MIVVFFVRKGKYTLDIENLIFPMEKTNAHASIIIKEVFQKMKKWLMLIIVKIFGCKMDYLLTVIKICQNTTTII